MKKIAIAIGLVIAVAVISVWAFRKPIGVMLVANAIEQNVGRDSLADLPDGLHVGLCGTGAPFPNIDRAGPCSVVVAGEKLFIVDAGENANRNIALMGINAAQAEAVFLTHFHSDHIDGLGALQLFHWTRGATETPLTVYGPEGVERVVEGFNIAYALDDTYRIAHHGEEVVPSTGGGSIAKAFEAPESSLVIYEEGGVRVTAFAVDHSPVEPAVGYRFDYGSRSVCLSGDTVRSSNLERVCKDVDILVHEALQPKFVKMLEDAQRADGNEEGAKIMFDIVDYHATPTDAAKSATTTGTDMLVLNHIVPPLPTSFIYPAFLDDAPDHYDGPIIVGEDGVFFSLPSGSDAIEETTLM